MSNVNNDPNVVINQVLNLFDQIDVAQIVKNAATIPAPTNAKPAPQNGALPVLQAPRKTSLSLESLLANLGIDQRILNCKEGLARIDSIIKEQQASHKEKEVELQKKIDSFDRDVRLAKAMKVFKWIGVALASISIVIGFATGGVLSVIGSILMTALLAIDIADEAVGGDAIAQLFSKFMSPEAAAKWSMGIKLALTIASVAVSCVDITRAIKGVQGSLAILTKLSSKFDIATDLLATVNSSKKAIDMIKNVAMATTAANSIISTSIGTAKSSYELDDIKSKALQEEINAIITSLIKELEQNQESYKNLVQHVRKMFDTTEQIVKDHNDTLGLVMGGTNIKA